MITKLCQTIPPAEPETSLRFWCPGCEENHVVPVTGKKAWEWNKSHDKPTLRPSVLVTSGHHIKDRGTKDCWCTYKAKHPESPVPFRCQRCHTFVTDGKIQFLKDCSHALAGQTIPMVDIPVGKENT